MLKTATAKCCEIEEELFKLLDDGEINSTDLVTLIRLAALADKDGWCRLPTAKLAEKCNVGLIHMYRVIKHLKRKKLIEVQHASYHDRQVRPRHVRVLVDGAKPRR